MVVRKILETTLTAGQTSVHFTDSDIPLSLIRVYTSDPDLLPIERTLSGNTVTVYFEEQSSNVGVALEIVKAGLDIIDDLTSTDATAALSAKQGKVLKDAIDGIMIPTVNDGELTIQKNGTTVATFTANQSTGATADISVPTTAADLAYVNSTSGLTADDVQEAIDELAYEKADTTSIGTDESGRTTASRSYAQGEHFYKDGKFCTAIADIAEGASLTLNTNYIEGTISDYLEVKEYTATSLQTWLTFATDDNRVKRSGNVVEFNLRFTITSMGTLSATADVIQLPFKHSNAIPCMFNIYANDSASGYPLSNVVPYIGSNGFKLRMLKGSTLANGSYYLSGTYLTKDSI